MDDTETASDWDVGFRQGAARAADGPAVLFERRYVGKPGHQVLFTSALGPSSGTGLCCLHATAYSARSLSPLMTAMAPRRRVFAIDTPGYGGSDRPSARPTIEGYARLIDEALDLAAEGQVDLFGYHTGALIAAELARQRPDRIRRLILIGVPFLHGAEQLDWRIRLARPAALTADLRQFEERWNFLVSQRPLGMSLDRGFENFVDELRSYPANWWAHEAAFTFDVAACLAAVDQPSLIINPANHLSAPSRLAAAALKNGVLHEVPHLENAIFDVAADELASIMDAFL